MRSEIERPKKKGIDRNFNQVREEKMYGDRLSDEICEANHSAEHICEIGLIHVVQPGDTLYRLSQKYHVSVSEIMYKNPYANLYHLKAGDELCIPVLGQKQ